MSDQTLFSPVGEVQPPRRRRPVLPGVFRSQRRNVGLYVGIAIVAVYVFVAIFAPLIAPYDPDRQNASAVLQDPSIHHLLGTDQLGRDVFSRVLYGARIDLLIALCGSILACIIGTAIGVLSGYRGGWVDAVLTRIMDMSQTIPFLVFAPVLLLVVGPSVKGVILAFALSDWTTYARLARSKSFVLRDLDFISASRLGGIRPVRILRRHMLPNVINDLLVYLTIDIVMQISSIAALGYLGMGVQPPTPEWGQIMFQGQQFLTTKWWIVVAPGIAIVVLGIGLALISDALLERQQQRQRGA